MKPRYLSCACGACFADLHLAHPLPLPSGTQSLAQALTRTPTRRVLSEDPRLVYCNPADPILHLDFRDPPRVNPDLAGAGAGGSELAEERSEGVTQRAPFSSDVRCPGVAPLHSGCSPDFPEGLSPLLNPIWLLSEGNYCSCPTRTTGEVGEVKAYGLPCRFQTRGPLRVPLNPLPGYIRCGPQGLVLSSKSPPTPLI